MEFGKVPIGTLESLDLSLPEDGLFTKAVLAGTRANAPRIHTGSAKWSRPEWRGIIYSEKAKDSEFLKQYARHFNSIELNATHYKIYPESSTQKWADQIAGKAFRFCPKVPQSISHYSDLSSSRALEQTSAFLQGISGFGEHLGPVFLQLSERFGPQRKAQLESYLGQWPIDVELFVEVRHAEWFSDATEREWLFGTLHRLGIGAVITDTAGRRDGVHMELPVPKTMIRFVGNGRHPTDFARIDEWVLRLKDWLDRGLETVYFFMHQPDEVFTPEMTVYFGEKMQAAGGISFPVPSILPPSLTLF